MGWGVSECRSMPERAPTLALKVPFGLSLVAPNAARDSGDAHPVHRGFPATDRRDGMNIGRPLLVVAVLGSRHDRRPSSPRGPK